MKKQITGITLPSLPVAIQGCEGSFHQVAVEAFFGEALPVLPCASFRELVRQAANTRKSGIGLMAIENSIAGSILPNYLLLSRSKLRIVGEVYLQIRQQLLVNPGVQLEDIREVHSHSMALQQCDVFLEKYPWKLVETDDTAGSARHIRRHRIRHVAAIASRLAAQRYSLDILVPNIHTLKNNYTRFLVLQPENKAAEIPDADKASVSFHTDHSRGSLARVLTAIAAGGINLSKLQSFPIPGSDFRYAFHADMEFNGNEQLEHVLRDLRELTEALRLYGVYKRGEWK